MTRCAVILLGIFAASCSPVSKAALDKRIKSLERSLQDHTGFVVYDPAEKKELYSFQSGQYFTPASNTKIFTLYTCLSVLGDSIPALRYVERGDSLIFKGTGDPSFLYEKTFDSRSAYDFLSQHSKQLYFSDDNFFTVHFGPGWAWDDYRYTFSAERSPYPVYGNYLSITYNGRVLNVKPRPFTYYVVIEDTLQKADLVREIGSNKILFYPGTIRKREEQWKVPFKTDTHTTIELLSDTLKREVGIAKNTRWDSVQTIYSVPADSLYKTMMHESDNFIAEQLLLVCSGVLSDSLKPEIAINFMKKNYLNDLPDKPVWADGSGLSRYNLFTPRSIVRLWEKIYEKIPLERLFPLLAIGGKTGTVKNWYKNEPPYIYGKTGTLSNNHSLSGYLVTKKGRTLIFSFMSNNHPASAGTVRGEMEKILRSLYEHY